MEPSRNNPVCQKCGLWESCKSPFMEPDGATKPKVLVVGEAPGDDEDRKGVPFIGRSGQLLRTAIDGIGLTSSDVTYTNVVRCRPKDNKISKQAIDYCKQFVIDEISRYKPKITLLMGNSPLEGVLGQIRISDWNGVLVDRKGKKYMPLYHPAYILRNQSAMDEWLTALMSVEDAIHGISKSVRYDLVVPKNMQDLLAMRKDLDEYEYISFDTEVTALNPYAEHCKLLIVSFGRPGVMYAVPIDHKESWFRGSKPVKEIVAEVLRNHDGGVIGHNLKFDQMHVMKHLNVTFAGYADTMLISYMMDSRRGIHGLKKLAGIHCDMYGYDMDLQEYIASHKEANPAKGGNYGEVPLEILLPYAGADVEAPIKLFSKLYPQLTDKQKKLHGMIMKFSDMLCDVQSNGMNLDHNMTKRYYAIYDTTRKSMYTELLRNKSIKKLLYIHREDKKKFRFNPNSFVHLSELYYGIIDIPVIDRTKGGKPTTSSKKLSKLEKRFPILYSIRQYRLLGSMLSKCLGPAVDGSWSSADGRVRSTYNLDGARTGRISSTKPNLQNIPTPEKEPGTLLEFKPIKNIFTHSYVNWKARGYIERYCDGVVMSADYSGMELRVFASLSKCMPMIDIHKSGKDFHSCVAIRAITHKPIEEITFSDIRGLPKPVRYKYKWTNWTLLFGGGAATLVAMYGMDPDDAKTMVRDYYDEFPEVLEYREDIIDIVTANGYVESPFGRREYLPDITSNETKRRNRAIREAINMPTQSAASDLTLCAGYVVYDKLKNGNYLSKIINEVHDSVMVDVPRYEIDDVADICKDAMENLKEHQKTYFPNIDFDWLICPLVADVEVGTHYGVGTSLVKWKELYG